MGDFTRLKNFTELILLANAKINLYLDITGRRQDGYHTLETVMQSVDLADVVTVRLTDGGIAVSCSDPLIPTDSGNTCYKAAESFFAACGETVGADIRIEKRIPHAAGLGGGSADAAAVLTALNALCGKPLSEKELLEVAAKTGADVPFCLTGGTKLCGGAGEELTDIKPFPERAYLIVMPDFGCDTKRAYLAYDENPLSPNGKLEDFLKSGENFPLMMYNVFEKLYNNGKIAEIISRLLEFGAGGASLSGSGAAVFGVFENEEAASDAARCFPKYFTAVCKAAGAGIIPVNDV